MFFLKSPPLKKKKKGSGTGIVTEFLQRGAKRTEICVCVFMDSIKVVLFLYSHSLVHGTTFGCLVWLFCTFLFLGVGRKGLHSLPPPNLVLCLSYLYWTNNPLLKYIQCLGLPKNHTLQQYQYWSTEDIRFVRPLQSMEKHALTYYWEQDETFNIWSH